MKVWQAFVNGLASLLDLGGTRQVELPTADEGDDWRRVGEDLWSAIRSAEGEEKSS